MPLLSSQSGISAKALGLTSSQFAAFGDGYWGQVLTNATVNTIATSRNPSVDSSGNVYVGGWYNPASSPTVSDIYALKVNSSGVLQWSNRFTTPQPDTGYVSTINSSNDLFIAGPSGSSTAGTLIKYNSAGTFQWAKNFIGSWTNVFPNAIKTDSSGNIYVAGFSYTGATNVYDAFTIKFDSTGAIVWQRFLGGVQFEGFDGIAIDGSGNVYVSGLRAQSPNTGMVAKYNSSGVLQWQKELSYPSVSMQIGDMAIDSSGNIYIPGYLLGRGILFKFDSSGNLTWQKTLVSTAAQYLGIAIDPSDYIYVVGGIDLTTRVILKYDSSGNNIFRRTLTGGSPIGICVDSSSMYIACKSSATDTFELFKLPSNGSKTGAYKIGSFDITYTSFSDTDNNGVAVLSTTTFTDSAGNFTVSASPGTSVSDSFTQIIQY
jgi:hypothetical protein